jgi:SAM-dependent methyltransferase
LALEAVRRGYRTLAVDLSPEMLKVLGAKATAQGLDVLRLQANLVDLGGLADESFAGAACLFSTLGLIQGATERRRFCDHVHRLLRPGGKFIVHVHNKWFLLRTRHGRRLLLGNRLRGDFLMPPHQGSGPLPMHLFTRREIRRLLRTTGFHLLECRPVSTASDGALRFPWLAPGWRAYGFLVAAQKPG